MVPYSLGKRSPVWSDGSQLFEWQFTRRIVRMIAIGLKKLDIHHTILVKEDKVDAFLEERVERVKNILSESEKPPIWISIHGNAARDPIATGIETWYRPNDQDSRLVASVFQRGTHKYDWLGLTEVYVFHLR